MVLDEDQKVHLAINRLGLATLSPFNPKYVIPNNESFNIKSNTIYVGRGSLSIVFLLLQPIFLCTRLYPTL